MKKALKKLSWFLVILFAALIGGSLVGKSVLRNGDYFSVNPDTKTIILGHSQPECGINDSLLHNVQNFSQGGESYFYTYQKLKKLVTANPQIENVVISYANNQIQERMDAWIWDDKYLYNSYPKYHFMMEREDIMLLAKHNFGEWLMAEAKTFKDFAWFIAKNRKNYLSGGNWGGYLYLERGKVDSLLKTDYLEKERRDIRLKLSEANLEYLSKIVQFCNEKNIKLAFLRMPVRADMPFLKNETQYQEVKRKRFSNIALLDFKDFPVAPDEFGDFDHLNHKGAKRFSKYFDMLIENGLLDSAHKQKDIDASIKTLFLKDSIR
jgi:hypothetical protein